MTVVVDASVAAKWLFQQQDTDKADAILNRVKQRRLSLLAPEILPAEIANFLWKAVTRAGLDRHDALVQYRRFQRACPALVRISKLSDPALRLALDYHHSVYNCLYVALALASSCDLVTADERLFNAFSPTLPQVRLLRSWV